MPKNWKTYKLSEALEIKYGKDHKKVSDGDIPIYGTGGIMRFGNQFLYDDESILIPRKGSLNNIYYLNKPFWTVDTLFWSKINKEIVFPKYLFYNLKILDFANMDVGTAIPSLTTKLLNKIEVNIPPLPEQKAIANILSTIDDKIENNLAVNKTLEDMAMALYKHWFVDFEPFQDGEFIDSELGLIPKGWEVKRLDDFALILNSKRVPLSTRQRSLRKGKFPYYGASGIIDYIDDYLFDGEHIIISEDGENLRSRKTPIAFRAVGKFWVNNHAHILRGKYNGIDQLIIAHIANLEMNPYLTGAVQPKLNKQNLLSIGIPYPQEDSIFQELLAKLYCLSRQIISNNKENQSLTKLRGTLLLKLINGEVRLKEFQEEIENVM